MADNVSFKIDELKGFVNDLAQDVKTKLEKIQSSKDSVSIGDMFDMQFAMNKLSQASEMTTSMASAMSQAASSIARGVKS